MTLVLSFVCGNAVIQTADRVLSASGRQTDRRANKTLVCVFPDGYAVLSYSGLAYLDGYVTDEWIARTLTDIWEEIPAPPGRSRGAARWSGCRVGPIPALAPFVASLDRLAAALEQLYTTFDAEEARIAPRVVAAGYRWYDRNPTEWFPVIWGVERRTHGYEAFAIVPEPLDEPYKVVYMPRWELLSKDEVNAVCERIDDAPTLADVGDILVEASRMYAARAPVEIGTDLIVVRIEPNESLSPTVRFADLSSSHAVIHRDSTNRPVRLPVAFTPWFITPRIACAPQTTTGVTQIFGHTTQLGNREVDLALGIDAPQSTVEGIVASVETQERRRDPRASR